MKLLRGAWLASKCTAENGRLSLLWDIVQVGQELCTRRRLVRGTDLSAGFGECGEGQTHHRATRPGKWTVRWRVWSWKLAMSMVRRGAAYTTPKVPWKLDYTWKWERVHILREYGYVLMQREVKAYICVILAKSLAKYVEWRTQGRELQRWFGE